MKTNLSHMPSNSFAGRIHSLKLESWPSLLKSSQGPSSLSWKERATQIVTPKLPELAYKIYSCKKSGAYKF